MNVPVKSPTLRPHRVLLGLLVLGVLWGCAPVVRETVAISPPSSLMAPLAGGPSGLILAGDGYGLPARVWQAPVRQPPLSQAGGAPRAVIIGVHGFNDYSNAFALPGPWFAEHGITTYAYDQRGFGRTPDAGRWPGTDRLVADLRSVVAAVRARHPGVPITLLGESMGAAVIITAMSGAKPLVVDGIVLAGPAVWGWSTLPLLPRASLWLADQIMPWQTLSPPRGFRVQASDNIAVLRGLGRDPLVIKETRTDAVYGLTDLMETAWQGAGRVRVPTLLLYGRRDELIPPEPVATISRRLAPVARQVVYPAGWHMLLRDLQRELVWRDIAAWTLDHGTPLPSGEERLPGTGFGGDGSIAAGP